LPTRSVPPGSSERLCRRSAPWCSLETSSKRRA